VGRALLKRGEAQPDRLSVYGTPTRGSVFRARLDEPRAARLAGAVAYHGEGISGELEVR
jgi:hypothetical protein